MIVRRYKKLLKWVHFSRQFWKENCYYLIEQKVFQITSGLIFNDFFLRSPIQSWFWLSFRSLIMESIHCSVRFKIGEVQDKSVSITCSISYLWSNLISSFTLTCYLFCILRFLTAYLTNSIQALFAKVDLLQTSITILNCKTIFFQAKFNLLKTPLKRVVFGCVLASMSFFVSGGLELVLEVSFLSQNLILEAIKSQLS